MTSTDAPVEPAVAGSDDPAAPPTLPGWREEGLLAVEIVGLAAFAVSRPILDSFGRSPETFVARNADAGTIVLFAVIVSVVPAGVLGAVGVLSRSLGARRRRRAHVAIVALAGAVAVWRLGQDVTGWPGDATKLVLLGLLALPLVGLVRSRFPVSATFLRYAGVASLLFLGQFLFVSPASSLVLSDGPRLDDDVAASVAAQVGDDAPDVVVVVFDALPLESLLDGTGRVDAAAFPNFARLAGTSTWYRNTTTNSIYTGFAVPAILTGRLPETESSGSYRPDPENLFTLLGGAYDVQAAEQVTALCPEDVCRRLASPGVKPLLGDAVQLWWDGTTASADAGGSHVPGALDSGRYARAEQWADGTSGRRGGRPRLVFQHVMVPHGPFVFTDDGTPYEGVGELPTGLFGPSWTAAGVEVGHQRHLLQVQAADRLLGRILDRLEAEGTFDDSLVVVTADHGEAFLPGEPSRGLSDANADQIAWVPLMVKAPGQRAGEIDDSNVQSIDIVPTVADAVGVDLPWEVDGIPANRAGDERDDGKAVADYTRGQLSDAGELPMVDLDESRLFAEVLAADAVEGDGPDGVWRRTAHGDLLGQEVATLTVDDEGADSVAVERLADIEGADSGTRLIELVGHTRLQDGTTVAYALDGTICALTEVGPGLRDQDRLAHALVPPAMFDDGRADLTAYVVTGPPGRAVLTPVEVVAA